MSKVRINDLAKELEIKSRAILDILPELGVEGGKTHSSSLEGDEADKVRAHFADGSRPASGTGAAARQGAAGIVPKIDLSHISKPGDVMKAILAKKKEEEEGARPVRVPAKPEPPAQPVVRTAPAAPAATPAATAPPARPEPRKIVPQPRQAPPIIAPPPAAPAIASRPPASVVAAKPPAGAVVAKPPAAAARPVVVVAPPAAGTAKPAHEEKPVAAKPAATHEAPAPAVEAITTPTAEAAAPESAASVPSIAAESTSVAPQQPQARVQPAPPARRMVMPQTGPRPVYKSTFVPPPAPVPGAAGGIQRGKPIFDRRPASGPAGPGQRGPGAPGSFAGGPPQAPHTLRARR